MKNKSWFYDRLAAVTSRNFLTWFLVTWVVVWAMQTHLIGGEFGVGTLIANNMTFLGARGYEQAKKPPAPAEPV